MMFQYINMNTFQLKNHATHVVVEETKETEFLKLSTQLMSTFIKEEKWLEKETMLQE